MGLWISWHTNKIGSVLCIDFGDSVLNWFLKWKCRKQIHLIIKIYNNLLRLVRKDMLSFNVPKCLTAYIRIRSIIKLNAMLGELYFNTYYYVIPLTILYIILGYCHWYEGYRGYQRIGEVD